MPPQDSQHNVDSPEEENLPPSTEFSDSMRDTLQTAPWHCLPHLAGLVCQYVASRQGYCLLVTDGVAGWCERRDATYVSEVAEGWAYCLEGNAEQLAALVLKELTAPDSSAKVSAPSLVPCLPLSLTLSSTLGSSPFTWHFHLTPLTPLQLQSHISLPLLTQLLALQHTVQLQQDHITHLQARLTQLLPDGTTAVDSAAKTADWRREAVSAACVRVLRDGPAVALRASLCADVCLALRSAPSLALAPPARARTQSGGKKRRLPVKRPRPPPGPPSLLPTEEQERRRAALSSISSDGAMRPNDKPKHKKLNI